MSECKDCGRSEGKCDRDQQPFTEQDNPVSPNHYQFPGGTEVVDISQHLSSLGGQIVQYVARSTRLDGHNKGKTVDARLQDLEKASTMIFWEINRLEQERGAQ